MSFRKTTYITAVCDGCGPDWWEGLTDRAPIFVSVQVARQELENDFECTTERQLDGGFRMLCPGCASKSECEKYGHVPFIASAEDPAVPMCRRCDAVIRDDEPPAGHPDSMTVTLSDAEEELLAALDEQLDPDRANEEV
jgi:hypothetical protein